MEKQAKDTKNLENYRPADEPTVFFVSLKGEGKLLAINDIRQF